ncbi:hypothetical protein EXE10_03825 [Acinetobacter sp. WCHAc060033]|uniref:hypothetical protein n=1 Tax=Acinetobacter sp. WCHAc060033 TaxID=2518624 RepID=UPI001022B881|nr:hypothetical protein [Acinetobacter sp. WCHAc060033]RZG87997.1 hypothetical protein EXE10_03825 [Acinetobacter sp. WCHAc060033]
MNTFVNGQETYQQLVDQIVEIKNQIKNLNEIAKENTLLKAISAQKWYGFKNKREIVFDSHTGILFPNFEYIPHISYEDWENEKKNYELNEIGKKLWRSLDDIGINDEIKGKYWTTDFVSHFPKKYSGKTPVKLYIACIDSKYSWVTDFHKDSDRRGNYLLHTSKNYFWEYKKDLKMLPALRVIDNPSLLPDYPRLTPHEKAKIILDSFIEKEWIPNFEPFLERAYRIKEGVFSFIEFMESEDEFQDRIDVAQQQCDEYNRIFDAYYQQIQLQKQLVVLESQIAELPEPAPINVFTSDFDYRLDLDNYDLPVIQSSVWQYSQASQQWINTLLNRIDEWENEHLDLVKNTVELNQELDKKLPVSINVTAEEKQLLEAQLQHLEKRLDLGLTPLRSHLINLLSEAQQISFNLEQTNTLLGLAQIEQQARPSFELLAEHTAILCTKTLKEMEWLDESLDFVKMVVSVLRKSAEDYLILVDKYQQDLIQIGLDNSIETEEITKWFAEWRNERLSLLKQIQPLLDAGLNRIIDEQTVLDVLPCIEQYQNELDQFYLQKRLGIHTTYAFQPNGHRQEKLEKEQELTKLVHQFMQQLEKVIFNTQTTAQKIWLIRFSEVWQQGVVNEITDFLAKEQLIERDDVVLIMSEELRKVQQQNLAACLQDAQSYSEALAQREKDVNTLIFKMRKALQK